MAEEGKKPHVSASQLRMMTNCGEQFRRRYIEKDIVPPGVVALVGKATHKSVEENMRHKAAEGVVIPDEQAMAIARDSLDREWDSGEVRLDEAEVAVGVKQVRGSAVDRAVTLAHLHWRDCAPNITPISPAHIERKFAIDVQNFPFDVVGIMDIQEADCIRDTKTTAKSPGKDDAHTSIQLGVYALGAHIIDRLPFPVKVAIDSLVSLKTPKHVHVPSERTEEDMQMLFRRLEIHADRVEKESFGPASPEWWGCTPKWCGYYHSCPYATRVRRPQT